MEMFSGKPSDPSQAHSKHKQKDEMTDKEREPRELIDGEHLMENKKAAEPETDSCATQTDLTMAMFTIKFTETAPLGLMDNTHDKDMWEFYTGFSYEIVKNVIFPRIGPYVTSTSKPLLCPFNQLLLTLVKLRLDLEFQDLAFNFRINAASRALSYFQNIIHIMSGRFKSLIIWPERRVSQMNIRTCFKEAFPDKTIVIIDCIEFHIEKPFDLSTQQQCWSDCKQHHTVKYLIGITPQGTISYISEGWGGRASDKQMVELTNFCTLIRPCDVVLADRGFIIEETMGVSREQFIIPAFTRDQKQLYPLEIEEARSIANVRINVERLIRVIKNEFRIFQGTLPTIMLQRDNDKLCMLDKIVTVGSALFNCLPSALPL